MDEEEQVTASEEASLEQTLVGDWQVQLAALCDRLGGRFKRVEVRRRLRRYLTGLLQRVERKNSWQLAEAMGESQPSGVQRLLRTAVWDVDGVRDDLQSYVREALGDATGIAVIDETGFLKKGTKSAGVKRQYSGTAGRVENAQVGVFLAYASSKGRAFLDRRLYLPAEWAADADRRREAGIAQSVSFATKPALARQMLAHAFTAGVPIAWVTGDEVYGKDGALRGWLEAERRPYVLAVACTHQVWLAGTDGEPVAAEVRALTAALPARAWARRSAGDGSKGPRWYDWSCVRLPRLASDGQEKWVLVRRRCATPSDLAYYRVYGPRETTLDTMVRVAGTRWIIEETIERAKGEVGLDQYEVRRYDGWYRAITLALVAHAFLEVTRAHANAALNSGERGARARTDPADGRGSAALTSGRAHAHLSVRVPGGLVPLAAGASGHGRLSSPRPPSPPGRPTHQPSAMNLSL
jgi:SRSO17 transposase